MFQKERKAKRKRTALSILVLLKWPSVVRLREILIVACATKPTIGYTLICLNIIRRLSVSLSNVGTSHGLLKAIKKFWIKNIISNELRRMKIVLGKASMFWLITSVSSYEGHKLHDIPDRFFAYQKYKSPKSKAYDCVDLSKLSNILGEFDIPRHLSLCILNFLSFRILIVGSDTVEVQGASTRQLS